MSEASIAFIHGRKTFTVYNAWNNGQLNFESAVAVPAIATLLADNFPEVEAFTRFMPADGVMSYNDPTQGPISFYEKKMQFADTSIFKVSDFELVSGNRAICLKGLDKAIISFLATNEPTYR